MSQSSYRHLRDSLSESSLDIIKKALIDRQEVLRKQMVRQRNVSEFSRLQGQAEEVELILSELF